MIFCGYDPSQESFQRLMKRSDREEDSEAFDFGGWLPAPIWTSADVL